LGVPPIAIDDGDACLLSTVTLDESHEAETDSIRASSGYSFVHESIDLSQQSIVHPCN
jgi:hypothetical protein